MADPVQIYYLYSNAPAIYFLRPLDLGEGLGGGGVTLISTYVGSGHFFVFEILNFNIFGGFSDTLIFFGVCLFVDIWGGGVITKFDYM